MTNISNRTAAVFTLLTAALYAPLFADEYNWSMRSSRNMVSPAENTPAAVSPENTIWKVHTGTHQYTIPVLDGKRIYTGANDASLKDDPERSVTRGGLIQCIERDTGKSIWKHHVPKFTHRGQYSDYHFNCFNCGICSSPVYDDSNIYLIASDGAVLALNKQTGKTAWRYDLITELKVSPHDVCGSTILIHKGILYACTSNGMALDHFTMPNKEAPSLIAIVAATGQLAAIAEEEISRNTFHGQWSSPAFASIGGREMVFFGGGDGKCYAFEALKESTDEVQTMRQLWVTDCNPESYRYDDSGGSVEYSTWHRRIRTGPSEIIGTVVVLDGRLYTAIGQSPYHGPGQGCLYCLDAGTGEIIWQNDSVERTTASAAVSNGLLFISDYSKQMHCIDAGTGENIWVHDLESDVWCSSPVVADGKVYIGTSRKDIWIFKASRNKEVISRTKLDSPPIAVVPDDGKLYVPTQLTLTAYDSETRNR